MEPVMVADKGHRVAIEQPTENLYGLAQPGNSGARRVESDTGSLVFGVCVARTQPELDSPLAQKVECGRFASEQGGVMEVIVEHHHAES